MRGRNRGRASELTKGILAGAAATWVMERVAGYLYAHEDPTARRREDEVRGDRAPFRVAADKTADLTGISMSEEQRERLGMGYHWGLGLGAGALYAIFRRRINWLDKGQGLVFGLAFFLIIDEALNTVLGLTPAPQSYPWQAHARGLAAHLTYGVVADTTLDVLDRAAQV